MTSNFHAVVLAARDASQPLVAGLTPADRTRRALAQLHFDRPATSDQHTVTLLLAADALLEPAAIGALVAGAAQGTAVVAAGDDPLRPAALALSFRDAPEPRLTTDGLAAVVARLRTEGRLRQIVVGDALCLRVADSTSATAASAVLLARQIRPTDGFFARHFDRHLSGPLSVRLVELGVSPNAVTVVAILVGLGGATLLAQAEHWVRVLGAGLFLISTILDGCDGEVARLGLRCSDFGRRLDLVGGIVTNAAVFVALGLVLGEGAEGGVPAPILYLTCAGLALATLVGLLFSRWLARTHRDLSRDWYRRLTGRDFAYVILPAAIIGRLHWVLWMAAVGSYIFAAAVLGCWAQLSRASAREELPIRSAP